MNRSEPTNTFRFWKFVVEEDRGYESPCWIWTGSRDPQGYGHFSTYLGEGKYKVHLVHRYAYVLLFGSIPEGLEIDHLCNQKSCVRHLEAVSHRENVRRAFR